MNFTYNNLSNISVTTGVTTHGDVRDQLNSNVQVDNANWGKANEAFADIDQRLNTLEAGGGGGGGGDVPEVYVKSVDGQFRYDSGTSKLTLAVNNADGSQTKAELPMATQSTPGAMSAADKEKLDSLTPGGGGGTGGDMDGNALKKGISRTFAKRSMTLTFPTYGGSTDTVIIPVASPGDPEDEAGDPIIAGLISGDDQRKLDGLPDVAVASVDTAPVWSGVEDEGLQLGFNMSSGKKVYIEIDLANPDGPGLMSWADREHVDNALQTGVSAQYTTTSISLRFPQASGESQSVTLQAARTISAGLMTAADKTKLDSFPTDMVTTLGADFRMDSGVFKLVYNKANGTTGYVELPMATSSLPGAMSAADKAKLDSLTTGGGSGDGGGMSSNAVIDGGHTSSGTSSFYLSLPLYGGGSDDISLPMASAGYAGLMSGTDKALLDGLGGGGVTAIKVVTALPGSPDENTLYIIK